MNKNINVLVLFLGDSQTGKSLCARRVLGYDDKPSYSKTIAIDHLSVVRQVGTSLVYKLVLWDIGGDDRFSKIIHSMTPNADLYCLFFDMSVHESFISLEKWYRKCQNSNIILVGTFSNPDTIVIEPNQIEEFCSSHKIIKFVQVNIEKRKTIQPLEHSIFKLTDSIAREKRELTKQVEIEKSDLFVETSTPLCGKCSIL